MLAASTIKSLIQDRRRAGGVFRLTQSLLLATAFARVGLAVGGTEPVLISVPTLAVYPQEVQGGVYVDVAGKRTEQQVFASSTSSDRTVTTTAQRELETKDAIKASISSGVDISGGFLQPDKLVKLDFLKMTHNEGSSFNHDLTDTDVNKYDITLLTTNKTSQSNTTTTETTSETGPTNGYLHTGVVFVNQGDPTLEVKNIHLTVVLLDPDNGNENIIASVLLKKGVSTYDWHAESSEGEELTFELQKGLSYSQNIDIIKINANQISEWQSSGKIAGCEFSIQLRW